MENAMVSRVERGPVADWFWTIDRLFLAVFVGLMGIGLMLSFAASPAVAERLGLDSFHFVERHGFFLLPALAVMIGVSFMSPRQVRRLALLLLVGAILMMILALFFGVEIKGSRRWVSILGVSLQPSEFMKPAFVVICAWLFAERSRHPEIPGNLIAMILFGIVAALLVAQPDLGQTMLTTAVWGAHVLHGRHVLAVDHAAGRAGDRRFHLGLFHVPARGRTHQRLPVRRGRQFPGRYGA
jgi:cell division protein FtsW